MSKLTFEQWEAAVEAACSRTRAVLELPHGMYSMEHAYSEAHLTVEEAVEYYSARDAEILAMLTVINQAWTDHDEDIFNNSVRRLIITS